MQKAFVGSSEASARLRRPQLPAKHEASVGASEVFPPNAARDKPCCVLSHICSLGSMLGLLGPVPRFDKDVIEDTKLIIDVAEKLGLDSVYCTIGCHPHDYRDFSDEAEKRLRADSWLQVPSVPRCRLA